MRVINVVYDMDDVLNNLNEEVYNSLGMQHMFKLQTRFRIRENTGLFTDEQMNLVLNAYKNPEIFKRLKPAKGVERILDIEGLTNGLVQVSIHSTSLVEEINPIKERFVSDNIPGFTRERLHLSLGHNKDAFNNADYIIEDSLENLLKYGKDTVKILIDKPHNQFDSYGIKNSNIIRVYSLDEGIDIIENQIYRRVYQKCII